jgi:hypothetical protein
LLFLQANAYLPAIRNCISLSTFTFQLSTVDKTRFVNPRITAFFATTGEFGVKKRGFAVAIFDRLTLLTFFQNGNKLPHTKSLLEYLFPHSDVSTRSLRFC